MCNSEEKLLQNQCVANVLQIYLNDFKETICDIGLITYRLSKTLIRSWIMKITQFPKNVVESSVQEFKHFFDLGPIPNDFDYSFLTISNFWDYIIINAKCYGENFANSYIGHVILSKFAASNMLSFIFLHILLPKLAFLLHRKISMQTFGLSERRFCALILSFMIGAGTHQLYLKWQQPILPVPPYYSPFVVAFVVEFICPKIGQNRRKFLSYPICSATLLCIVYGIFYQQFDFIYLFSTIVAIGFTFANLQRLLGKGYYRSDYASAHDHIALPINSMYNQLICTILFGTYIPNRAPHEAIPDAFEEQYTMIAH
ncbi:putative integral membrane protein [Brugia pahangi]